MATQYDDEPKVTKITQPLGAGRAITEDGRVIPVEGIGNPVVECAGRGFSLPMSTWHPPSRHPKGTAGRRYSHFPKWQVMSEAPGTSYFFAIQEYQDQMFVSMRTNDTPVIQIYDPATDLWTPSLTASDNVNCMIVFEDQLYAGTNDGACYLYNGSVWTPLASLSHPYGVFRTFSVYNDILFAGGHATTLAPLPIVYRFEDNAWITELSVSGGVQKYATGASFAEYHNEFYLGGWVSAVGTPVLWKRTPTGTWEADMTMDDITPYTRISQLLTYPFAGEQHLCFVAGGSGVNGAIYWRDDKEDLFQGPAFTMKGITLAAMPYNTELWCFLGNPPGAEDSGILHGREDDFQYYDYTQVSPERTFSVFLYCFGMFRGIPYAGTYSDVLLVYK